MHCFYDQLRYNLHVILDNSLVNREKRVQCVQPAVVTALMFGWHVSKWLALTSSYRPERRMQSESSLWGSHSRMQRRTQLYLRSRRSARYRVACWTLVGYRTRLRSGCRGVSLGSWERSSAAEHCSWRGRPWSMTRNFGLVRWWEELCSSAVRSGRGSCGRRFHRVFRAISL